MNGICKKIVVFILVEVEFFVSYGYDDIIYGKFVSELQMLRQFDFCNDFYSL